MAVTIPPASLPGTERPTGLAAPVATTTAS